MIFEDDGEWNDNCLHLTVICSAGEDILEISTLHSVVSITTCNIYNGTKTVSSCELNNENVKKVIETLQKLVR